MSYYIELNRSTSLSIIAFGMNLTLQTLRLNTIELSYISCIASVKEGEAVYSRVKEYRDFINIISIKS